MFRMSSTFMEVLFLRIPNFCIKNFAISYIKEICFDWWLWLLLLLYWESFDHNICFHRTHKYIGILLQNTWGNWNWRNVCYATWYLPAPTWISIDTLIDWYWQGVWLLLLLILASKGGPFTVNIMSMQSNTDFDIYQEFILILSAGHKFRY